MADIVFIMERVGEGQKADSFMLYACRGEGKGCQRNKFRAAKKHCADCLPADNPNETLADFRARLQRGHS